MILKQGGKLIIGPNQQKFWNIYCAENPWTGQKMLLIFITWLLPGACYEYTHKQNMGEPSFLVQHWYFMYAVKNVCFNLAGPKICVHIVRCYLLKHNCCLDELTSITLHITHISICFVEHKSIFFISGIHNFTCFDIILFLKYSSLHPYYQMLYEIRGVVKKK